MTNKYDAISSETYAVEIEDLLRLPRCENSEDGKVCVLIGNSKKHTKDCLLSGGNLLEQLPKGSKVDTRFAFQKRAFLLKSLFCHFVKPFRRGLMAYSSEIYHIDPFEIRQKHLERSIRTRENAYQIRNKKWGIPLDDRLPRYERLVASIREKGFDDEYPMDMMLCRKGGWKDNLFQGHHRMSALIEADVHRAGVRFCAAGYLPMCLKKIFGTRS